MRAAATVQAFLCERQHLPASLVVRTDMRAHRVLVSGSGADVLRPADLLVTDTLGGDDTVDSSGLEAGLVQLRVL